MVHQGHWLGVFRARQPGVVDPLRRKSRVKALQLGDEILLQGFFCQLEIGMVCWQVVADIDDVVAAEIIR